MNEEKLFQEIEQLKQEVADLKASRGLRAFMRRAFSKSSFIIGIVLAAALTGFLAWAAQISFVNGEIISAADVNANFTELYNRVAEIEGKNKIINITTHTNATETVLGSSGIPIVETFTVDKKSPTGILLIQGTMAGYGSDGGETQIWTYGTGMPVYAQSNNGSNGNMVTLPTTAIIEGHTTVGPQTLQLSYMVRPFIYYNPGPTLCGFDLQTKSVFIVSEIEL